MSKDTRFAGFAALLWNELETSIRADPGFIPEGETTRATFVPMVQQIIARRAYELVRHATGYSLEYLHECGREISGSMGTRILASIPDMTAWSEESSPQGECKECDGPCRWEYADRYNEETGEG